MRRLDPITVLRAQKEVTPRISTAPSIAIATGITRSRPTPDSSRSTATPISRGTATWQMLVTRISSTPQAITDFSCLTIGTRNRNALMGIKIAPGLVFYRRPAPMR